MGEPFAGMQGMAAGIAIIVPGWLFEDSQQAICGKFLITLRAISKARRQG